MAYIDTKHFYKCETCKNFIEESWCDVPCQEKEFYLPDISKIPAADVVEVKHGEWDDNIIGFCNVCSECGAIIERMAIKNKSGALNYCPNCGAKMDGRSDTNE